MRLFLARENKGGEGEVGSKHHVVNVPSWGVPCFLAITVKPLSGALMRLGSCSAEVARGMGSCIAFFRLSLVVLPQWRTGRALLLLAAGERIVT